MENNKKDSALVRSSAAEYLTFVASTGEDKDSIEMRYEDENIWLTQKMMATLYDVGLPTINEHIKKIYADHEQDEAATIRKFRIVQNEGGRQVTRSVNHYNLQMIIAVGFKVNNQRAVRFRVWANQIVEQYTIKGWAMDEERLKNGGTVLTKKYFEEQLERIREIRISERNFYQKLTDIYATSLDYDRNALTTKEFFAKVQNKMHYAVHRHTAAELIYERADAEKPHMGLHTWKDAPNGKIKKSDVSVAKNYLTEDEMKSMELIVSAYLDLAENRARRHIPMTMEDWAKRLDIYLQADDLEVLKDAGKISAQLAKMHAETEFEKYRVVQDRLYQSDFDRYLEETIGTECPRWRRKAVGKIRENEPLPPHTRLSYDECYAKLILEKFFPNKYENLQLSDKPDLRDLKHNIGIEVTSAIPKEEQEALNLAAMMPYVDEQAQERRRKRLKKMGYRYTKYGMAHPPESYRYDGDFNDVNIKDTPCKRFLDAYEEKIRKLNSGNYAELEGYELYVYSEEVIDSWMIPKLIQAVNSINVGVKKYRYIYFVTLCEILVFDTEHDECAGIDIAGGRKLDGLGEKARKIVEAGEKR